MIEPGLDWYAGVVLPDLPKDSRETRFCHVVLHSVPPAPCKFYQDSTPRAQPRATTLSRTPGRGFMLGSMPVANCISSNLFKEEEE
jgi:hypothetical protein